MTLSLIMVLIICSSDIETNPCPKKNTKISFYHWNLNGIAAHNFSKVSLYCGLWLQCMSLILYLCRTRFLILRLTCLMIELIQKDTIIKEQTTLIIRERERSLYVFQRTPSILRRNNFCNLPECLVTEIRKGKNKWFFTCLYRSPSQNSVEFDTFCFTLNLFLSNINELIFVELSTL